METPNLAVVINPHKMPVSIDWMVKELNVDLIITNSYILRNSKFKEDIIEKGIHKFLGFDGVVYTDSGTFQMYSRGKANITNEETIAFQKEIGSDVVTPLDLFTLPSDSKDIAKKKLIESFKRAKVLDEMRISYSLPLQGGLYTDLRDYAAKLANNYNASIYAIGGIVPLMESYDFVNLVRVIYAVKKGLNPSFPVHAFGAGHPLVFSLLTLMGVDVFDSASYALYAYDKRMICPNRTYDLRETEYFPCGCRYCEASSPKELSIEELAKHNLAMIFEEINAIKAAIHEGTIYDYVEYRIGSRPELVKAYRWLLKYGIKWLKRHEPATRKRGFLTRDESFKRPLIRFTKERMSYVQSKNLVKSWMGETPLSLMISYPFSQVSAYKREFNYYEEAITFMNQYPEDFLKDVLSYQFRNSFPYSVDWSKVSYVFSKTTKRLREVKLEGKVMLTLRSYDNFFVPSERFYFFLKDQNIRFPYEVVVSDEAKDFVSKGRNVFAKFVKKVYGDIHPKDYVVLLSENNEFLGIGEALLTFEEMKFFKRGVAVKRK